MALVDTTTGEIVSGVIVDVDPEWARDLTDRIRTTAELSWDLITEAYETACWVSLGYSSWDDYCGAEFGGLRLVLPREDRREVVASLRESGLSTRAIAAVTGVSQGTVRNDLNSGEQNCSPAQTVEVETRFKSSLKSTTEPPKSVKGTDGKTYMSKPPAPKLTDEEQRAKDIEDGNRRAARYLEQLTDVWPYFESFHNGRRRDEVAVYLQQPTLDVLAKIEEQMR